MKKLIFILTSLMMLSSVQASTSNIQCLDEYKSKVEGYYPNLGNEEELKWVYKLKGYHWLSNRLGKPGAAFTVAVVPGAIPVVIAITGVAGVVDLAKNEKGITGAYIVLNLSQYSEEELEQKYFKEVVDGNVQAMQKRKFKKEENLFNTFVKKVNKKYKNSNFSYEEVRAALLKVASRDKKLCRNKKMTKAKFSSYKKLIRLTKKELISI